MAAARRREADPPTQLRQLAAGLREGGLARAYVLRGEEVWFRESGARLLVDKARAEGLEVLRHDESDPEFSLPALIDDLTAAPLFAGARCILVRNAAAIMKKSGKDHSAFVRAALGFLESTQIQGTLVLSSSSLRADHVLAKKVKALGGTLVACRKLWETAPAWDPDPRKAELVQWLLGRARDRGVGLSPDEAAYVAAATGNDLAALDTQLDKLAVRGGQSLNQLVPWQSGGSPWQAADEILSGKRAHALAAVEALFRSGTHFKNRGERVVDGVALANMLANQLRSKTRQYLLAARELEAGRPADQVAAAAGITARAGAREGFLETLRLRSASAWRGVYERLAGLERALRSRSAPDVNDFVRLTLELTRDAAREGNRRSTTR